MQLWNFTNLYSLDSRNAIILGTAKRPAEDGGQSILEKTNVDIIIISGTMSLVYMES